MGSMFYLVLACAFASVYAQCAGPLNLVGAQYNTAACQSGLATDTAWCPVYCAQGYWGNAVNYTCLAGAWQGTPPTCQKTCPDLRPVLLMSYNTSACSSPAATAGFSCRVPCSNGPDGTQISPGSFATFTCTGDASNVMWTNTPLPICSPPPPPPTQRCPYIAFGPQYTWCDDQSPVGAWCQVSCNGPNYVATSAQQFANITCGINATTGQPAWQVTTLPTCTQQSNGGTTNNSCVPTPFGAAYTYCNATLVGATCDVRCLSSGNTATLTCTRNPTTGAPQWSGALPNCSSISNTNQCPFASFGPAYTYCSAGSNVGAWCMVRCAGSPSGTGTNLTCIWNATARVAQWNMIPLPVCNNTGFGQPGQCGSISFGPSYTTCNAGSPVGAFCTVSCVGSPSATATNLTCIWNATAGVTQWNIPPLPNCNTGFGQPDQCGPISFGPSYTNCSAGSPVGAFCTVRCKNSIDPRSVNVTCIRNATNGAPQWSTPALPNCTVVLQPQCPPLPNIGAGYTFACNGTTSGSFCTVACQSGYNQAGVARTITCGTNPTTRVLQWNVPANIPTCTLPRCGAISFGKQYSSCAANTYSSGSSCTVTCATGYTMLLGSSFNVACGRNASTNAVTWTQGNSNLPLCAPSGQPSAWQCIEIYPGWFTPIRISSSRSIQCAISSSGQDCQWYKGAASCSVPAGTTALSLTCTPNSLLIPGHWCNLALARAASVFTPNNQPQH